MVKCLFIALFLTSTIADGATVIRKIRKRSVIVIDEGKDDGLTKGTKLCVFKDNGKKTACGKIRRLKSNKAFIKVPRRRFRTVKKGMEVRSPSGGSVGGGGMNIKAMYIYTMTTPTTYSKLAFASLPNDEVPIESAWVATGNATAAPFGFGGELELPIMGFQTGLGFRMRSRSFISTSDYSARDTDLLKYIEISQTESATGFWATFYFTSMDLGGAAMNIGGGVDLEQSSLTVQITQKADPGENSDAEEKPVFDGSGSVMTISLTGTALLNIDLGGMYLFGGAKFYLPVSGGPGQVSGNPIEDEVILATSDLDPNEDLNFVLGYGKAGFGLEFPMGLTIEF